MTAGIKKENIVGIVTETGSQTSHSAILARAMEIPAVLSVPNALTKLSTGEQIIVDGNTLQDVAQWDDSPYRVGCITVYCGKTPIRLIDHIKYKE